MKTLTWLLAKIVLYNIGFPFWVSVAEPAFSPTFLLSSVNSNVIFMEICGQSLARNYLHLLKTVFSPQLCQPGDAWTSTSRFPQLAGMVVGEFWESKSAYFPVKKHWLKRSCMLNRKVKFLLSLPLIYWAALTKESNRKMKMIKQTI